MSTKIELSVTEELDQEQQLPCGDGPKILVAALGNELLMDDGVGIHLARALREAQLPGENTLVVEVGTAVLDALHLFEWADYVLALDAVKAGKPEGTVYYFDVAKAGQGSSMVSLHEFSLTGTLSFISKEDRPHQVMIVGIEPAQMEFGMELTPRLQNTLASAVEICTRITRHWIEKGPVPPEATF